MDWIIDDAENEGLCSGVGIKKGQAICKAVNTHDQKDLDIHRLLEGLKPFAEEWGWRIGIGDLPNEIPERIRIAHQLRTELTKRYGE